MHQSHTSISVEDSLMISLNTLISAAGLDLDLTNFEKSPVSPLRFAHSMGAVVASHIPINNDYFYLPFTSAYFANDGILSLPEGLGVANLSINFLNAEIVTSEMSVEVKIRVQTPDSQSSKAGFLTNRFKHVLSDYDSNEEAQPMSYFPECLEGLFSCLKLAIETNNLQGKLPTTFDSRLEFDKGLAYIVGNWLKEIG